MKIVIHTQFRENYGAHDWDGKGECPQYWKFKGGDTYVLNVSLDEAQDPSFYDAVYKCIEHSSDYSQEYVIGESLVDDCDFDPATVVEEWDTYIYATFEAGVLACTQDVKGYDMSNTVIGQRSWLQDENGKREIRLEMFEEAA